MKSIIKKKDIGDDNDSFEKGVDKDGIKDREKYVTRNGQYLFHPAELEADRRAKAISQFLTLPYYENYKEKKQYDKIKDAVSQDLYEVFKRQEQDHLSCIGVLYALVVTLFIFTVVYFNVPCGLCFPPPPPPKPIDNCVCPYPFNYTTKNLLNGEEENGTTNISMNVTFSMPDEIGPFNNTANNTYRQE